MTRPLRNDDDQGWFHVTNRGARKYDTFIDDRDRVSFLRMVAKHSSSRGIEVAAFCLMANHFHLVLFCPDGYLSSAMQGIGAEYTKTFNRAHGFGGPLFGQRFHSKHLSNDHYLLTATRYVHRNPLEVGVDIATYGWSSYPCYLSGRSRSVAALAISCSVPIAVAGDRESYVNFVERDLPTDKSLRSDGNKAFEPSGRTAPSLGKIDQAVASACSAAVASGGPRRELSRRAQLAVLLAVDRGAHSVKEIADHHRFGSSKSVYTALRRGRRRIEVNPEDAVVIVRARHALRSEESV